MAEQELGGLNVGLDPESMRMLEDVVQSSLLVAENMEKAGQVSDEFSRSLKEATEEQRQIALSLQSYDIMSRSILTSVRGLSDTTGRVLEANKEITSELVKQRTEVDRKAKTEADSAAKQQAAAKQQSQKVARAITSPVQAGVDTIIKRLPGKLQVALIGLGTVAKVVGDVATEMRDIARTGGEGMAAIGAGATLNIRQEMLFAEARIPILKERYATREQMVAGMGTMFGLGGVRGEELSRVMEDLPKMAYEAGVTFGDASAIIAKMNRLQARSGEELIDTFQYMVTSAKSAGEKISDFAKQVVETTVATRAYGYTEDEVSDLRGIVAEDLKNNRISLQDFNAAVLMAARSGIDSSEAALRLRGALTLANREGIKLSDQMSVRLTVEKVLSRQTENMGEAVDKSSRQMVDYGAKVAAGARNLALLESTLGKLLPILGEDSQRRVVGFTDELEGYARQQGLVAETIVNAGAGFVETFARTTQDYDTSVRAGGAVAKALGEELSRGVVSFSEVNSYVGTMAEKFSEMPDTIVTNIQNFKMMADQFDVTTGAILKWQLGMSEGMTEMFDTPREALRNAEIALAGSIHLLKTGQVTTSDYTKVLRTQMDVFGKSGAEAATHFGTLAHIVDDTSVRMSELAAQTEALAKINRQFGIDQRVSTAMLVRFNEGIRAGTVSIEDLQTVLKGPAGAQEGPQALLINTLQAQGGALGQMFQGTDVLGGLELLRDFQRYASGQGRATTALIRTIGGEEGTIGEARQRFREQIREAGGSRQMLAQMQTAFSEMVREMIPEGGPAAERAFFRRLTPAIFGREITAQGRDMERLMRTFFAGGDISRLAGTIPGAPEDYMKNISNYSQQSVSHLSEIEKTLKGQYTSGLRDERGQPIGFQEPGTGRTRRRRRTIVGNRPTPRPERE